MRVFVDDAFRLMRKREGSRKRVEGSENCSAAIRCIGQSFKRHSNPQSVRRACRRGRGSRPLVRPPLSLNLTHLARLCALLLPDVAPCHTHCILRHQAASTSPPSPRSSSNRSSMTSPPGSSSTCRRRSSRVWTGCAFRSSKRESDLLAGLGGGRMCWACRGVQPDGAVGRASYAARVQTG